MTDGIIQDGQPLFGLVWVGSILSLFIVSILGFWQLGGGLQWLLLLANLAYIAGAQLPTFIINVPRNNALQALNVASADDATLAAAREHFEATWNRSNNFRTLVSIAVSVLLLIVLFQI